MQNVHNTENIRDKIKEDEQEEEIEIKTSNEKSKESRIGLESNSQEIVDEVESSIQNVVTDWRCVKKNALIVSVPRQEKFAKQWEQQLFTIIMNLKYHKPILDSVSRRHSTMTCFKDSVY